MAPFPTVVLLKGKYEEADPLSIRAISVLEKAVAPDHQEIANMLNQRAILLDAQVTSCLNLTMLRWTFWSSCHAIFDKRRGEVAWRGLAGLSGGGCSVLASNVVNVVTANAARGQLLQCFGDGYLNTTIYRPTCISLYIRNMCSKQVVGLEALA